MTKPTISIGFEPRDLWVGIFWKRTVEKFYRVTTFYVCVVPCLPIRIDFYSKRTIVSAEGPINKDWWKSGNTYTRSR